MTRVEQHELELPVENLDFFDDPQPKKHGELFPNSCRILFAGPSGCGKSNALLSLLFNANGLKFENVYIFSKSLYQPKYRLLSDVLNGIPEIGYFPYSENEDIVDIANVLENSIFIADDVIGDKQDKIKTYYSMGRHKKIDVIFLCQTYVKISKHLIRDNSNIIVLFKQDYMNLKHAFDEHVSPDMIFDKFKEICSLCWEEKHGFLVIVKEFPLSNGRYRIGFDKYIRI